MQNNGNQLFILKYCLLVYDICSRRCLCILNEIISLRNQNKIIKIRVTSLPFETVFEFCFNEFIYLGINIEVHVFQNDI